MKNKLLIPIIFNVALIIFPMLIIANGQCQEVKPEIQLATVYSDQKSRPNFNIRHYWVSEKLDGVRGRWTGTQLLTRQGHLINTPKGFTKNWPKVALDGELWIKRGLFDQVSGIVRRKIATKQNWQNIRFMVFDLPKNKENFSQRLKLIKVLVDEAASPTLVKIEQIKLSNTTELTVLLDKVVNRKGEGLMLHHQAALYKIGRSNQLLKVKKHNDSEAQVIAYIPGKGKNKGKMGSLLVKTNDDITFKIGTGFSKQQRMTPPPIGCIITFKYFGKSQNGVPRFASFMRIRSPNRQEKFSANNH